MVKSRRILSKNYLDFDKKYPVFVLCLAGKIVQMTIAITAKLLP